MSYHPSSWKFEDELLGFSHIVSNNLIAKAHDSYQPLHLDTPPIIVLVIKNGIDIKNSSLIMISGQHSFSLTGSRSRTLL